jgi:hypothetical protein
METIALLQKASETYSDLMHYSDVAGVRQLQFLKDCKAQDFLDKYYTHESI